MLAACKQMLEESNNVVITCHISPDGDAIGSNLALKLLLEKMGKTATVVSPDTAPTDMHFLPDCTNIISYTVTPQRAEEAIKAADLICCLDFNAPKRLGGMGQMIVDAKCRKLMIDHHIEPDTSLCDVIISYPQMTSACELLYRVIEGMGMKEMLDKKIASCIYTGMMTDTGNFSFNSNFPELYLIVAELVRLGVDKDRIYKLTLGTSSEARLRLNSYAIAEKMRLFPSHKAALTILDRFDLKKFHYQVGDTETLANMPLAIPSVIWSTYFREERGYRQYSGDGRAEAGGSHRENPGDGLPFPALSAGDSEGAAGGGRCSRHGQLRGCRAGGGKAAFRRNGCRVRQYQRALGRGRPCSDHTGVLRVS